jgi:predicted alpha/beta-hydrolase family hydrolase
LETKFRADPSALKQDKWELKMIRHIFLCILLISTTHTLNAEEVKINSEGLTLNANLNLADGKSMADGIVLMVHGTFAHKDMEIMSVLQEGLLERNISNLAINLSYSQDNRHGMLGCKNVQNSLDADAIKEIGVWVNWLNTQGAYKITILGHSSGGNRLARYLASSVDENIAAAVMIAPPVGRAGKSVQRYKKSHGTDLKPILAKALALVEAGKGNSLMDATGFLFCPKTVVSAATFVDNYTDSPDRDTPTVIQRLTLPILVVVGTNDTIVSDLIPVMRSNLQSNVNFVEIEDAGHFFLDFFGEDLVDTVEEFLNTDNS